MTKNRTTKKVFRVIILLLLAVVVIGILTTVISKSIRDKGKEYELVSPTPNDTIRYSTIITGSIKPRDEILVKPQMNGILSELKHTPGDYVEAGELLGIIRMVPDIAQVQNAAARVESTSVAYQQAEKVYKRDLELYNQKILSKEDYEKSLASYQMAKIDLSSAKEQLELVSKGSSASTANKNNTLVRATVSGTILEQPVKVGETVIMANAFNAGTTVASIADLNDLLFIGEVNESDINNITYGDRVNITIGALKNRLFGGIIEYVSPKGIERSGSILFEVKAALDKQDLSGIKAGFSSNAEIILEERNNVLSIPENCITYEGTQAYVFISKDGNAKEKSFEKKQIEVGLSDGLQIEVLSGLKGDELLRGSLKALSNN